MDKQAPVNNGHALLAERIRKAMVEGKLGEPFRIGTMEFSRVRACCEWLIENKPERPLFTSHLASVLRHKHATVHATLFADALDRLGIVRTPVTDPEVVKHIEKFHAMRQERGLESPS